MTCILNLSIQSILWRLRFFFAKNLSVSLLSGTELLCHTIRNHYSLTLKMTFYSIDFTQMKGLCIVKAVALAWWSKRPEERTKFLLVYRLVFRQKHMAFCELTVKRILERSAFMKDTAATHSILYYWLNPINKTMNIDWTPSNMGSCSGEQKLKLFFLWIIPVIFKFQ